MLHADMSLQHTDMSCMLHASRYNRCSNTLICHGDHFTHTCLMQTKMPITFPSLARVCWQGDFKDVSLTELRRLGRSALADTGKSADELLERVPRGYRCCLATSSLAMLLD